MKWQHVQQNWAAFYEAIVEKWPEVDESDLDEIDGDQRAFIAHLAETTGQEPSEIREGAVLPVVWRPDEGIVVGIHPTR